MQMRAVWANRYSGRSLVVHIASGRATGSGFALFYFIFPPKNSKYFQNYRKIEENLIHDNFRQKTQKMPYFWLFSRFWKKWLIMLEVTQHCPKLAFCHFQSRKMSKFQIKPRGSRSYLDSIY